MFLENVFQHCQITFQQYNTYHRRFSNMSKNFYRKLSSVFFSLPSICLLSHFSFLLVKIIKLSDSTSIIFSALLCNYFNCTSDSSPSKTEFCIQFKQVRHSFSILPTLFYVTYSLCQLCNPCSYAIYALCPLPVAAKPHHHQILNGTYSLSSFKIYFANL